MYLSVHVGMMCVEEIEYDACIFVCFGAPLWMSPIFSICAILELSVSFLLFGNCHTHSCTFGTLLGIFHSCLCFLESSFFGPCVCGCWRVTNSWYVHLCTVFFCEEDMNCD